MLLWLQVKTNQLLLQFFAQIFRRNIVHIDPDACAPLVAVFVGDLFDLRADHAEQQFPVSQNCLILFDFTFSTLPL